MRQIYEEPTFEIKSIHPQTSKEKRKGEFLSTRHAVWQIAGDIKVGQYFSYYYCDKSDPKGKKERLFELVENLNASFKHRTFVGDHIVGAHVREARNIFAILRVE